MTGRAWIQAFMEEQRYPKEAQKALLEDFDQLPEEALSFLERIEKEYRKNTRLKMWEYFDEFRSLSGVHSYRADMLFFMVLTEELWAKYEEAGISRKIWYDTTRDFYYKVIECHKLHGMWGTFVPGWFVGFFWLIRFALGRLQFEHGHYHGPETLVDGIVLKENDRVLDIHIPSAGPLTKEGLEDSYRQAAEFFADYLEGDPVIFHCESWLLSSVHLSKLPEESGMRLFASSFSLVQEREQKNNHDLWRIYYGTEQQPVALWPRETALQRIYAEHVEAGGHMTEGLGVFLFKKEK